MGKCRQRRVVLPDAAFTCSGSANRSSFGNGAVKLISFRLADLRRESKFRTEGTLTNAFRLHLVRDVSPVHLLLTGQTVVRLRAGFVAVKESAGLNESRDTYMHESGGLKKVDLAMRDDLGPYGLRVPRSSRHAVLRWQVPESLKTSCRFPSSLV